MKIQHFKYKHKYNNHFYFEKTNKPFFGPKQAINIFRVKPIPKNSEETFLEFISEQYPEVYKNLEWVRFHMFDYQESTHVRIAVINLLPDPIIRDFLFEKRLNILDEIGWYPVVQGSRAAIHFPPYMKTKQQIQNRRMPIINTIGDLEALKPLSSSSSNGSCFELIGKNGSILLDSGFKIEEPCQQKQVLAFLSHYHRDHSGGLIEYFKSNETPLLISKTALTFLWNLPVVERNIKSKMAANSLHPEDKSLFEFYDGSSLKLFPVFHAPGAYGIQVTDARNNVFTYLGDLCLRNGFVDYYDKLLSEINTNETKNHTLLLDGTMIGRNEKSVANIEPQDLFRNIQENSMKRDLIITSNQVETLLYTYIQAFHDTRSIKPPIRILLSNELIIVLKTLWESIILHKNHIKDPFLDAIFGKSMSNFVETHRLYPINNQILNKINIEEKVIIFASPYDMEKYEQLHSRINDAEVIITGTMALSNEIPEKITQLNPYSVSKVMSSNWGFHSDEENLKELIDCLIESEIKIILFHNYPGRLKKFIKRNNYDPSKVQVISKDTISLI